MKVSKSEQDIESIMNKRFTIRRTESFVIAAKALSEYIKVLPLSRTENDGLVELMINQVHAAERGGFAQGFAWGSGLEPMEFEDDTNH